MAIVRRGGAHILKLIESGADPAAIADVVQVYSKDDAGIAQLFARSSDGTVHQLTPSGGSSISITPAALAAGTTNNYAPAGIATAKRLRQATNAANSLLGGIDTTGFVDGHELLMFNLGPGTLTLVHAEAGSAPVNQFSLEGSANRMIGVFGAVLLSYDANSARLRCIG
jgi:hypothetical protein